MVAARFLQWRFLAFSFVLLAGLWVGPSAHAQISPIVDVNAADISSLTNLPGITPSLAKRIIKGRPYHGLEDLQRVKGMTDAKVEALLGRVNFGTNAMIPVDDSGTNASAAEKPTKKPAVTKVGPGEKIDINKATAAQLTRLPGIGESKAQAIVAYRTQNGPFRVLEDIEKVDGIKAGLFAKLKDHIVIISP